MKPRHIIPTEQLDLNPKDIEGLRHDSRLLVLNKYYDFSKILPALVTLLTNIITNPDFDWGILETDLPSRITILKDELSGSFQMDPNYTKNNNEEWRNDYNELSNSVWMNIALMLGDEIQITKTYKISE